MSGPLLQAVGLSGLGSVSAALADALPEVSALIVPHEALAEEATRERVGVTDDSNVAERQRGGASAGRRVTATERETELCVPPTHTDLLLRAAGAGAGA